MTRKELSQVYYLNKELQQREKQLAELIQASQLKSPQVTGMPFQNTGETSDKVADYAIKLVTYTEQVNAYKQALEIRKMAIDNWVMKLEDSYLRQIIHYRCYDLMSWRRIATIMNTTEDCIRMYFNRHIPK